MTRLPPPPAPEPPAVTSLDVLAPRFAVAVQLLLDALRAAAQPARVAETLRTAERQRWLYGSGREYDDGRGMVTNARTGLHSWHAYGLAADLVSATDGWDAPATFWEALGRGAETHGLTWGGRWTSPDRPHVQWGAPMRVSPTWRAVALRATGGNAAVWRAVGAS